MNKAILLILILVLSTPSLSLAAEGTWTSKANMATARTYLSTSVVNDKIYAIGGGPRGVSPVSTVEEYDPVTDTWTTKSPMPTPRWSLSTSAVNGKIYAIGGAQNGPSGLRTVEEYDPVTDSWTRKANMLTPRFTFSTSVINGRIYAIGGGVPTGTRIVEEYDPATDTWTRKADMLTPRAYAATSVVNGQIFAMGGAGPDPDSPPIPTVEVYDPETDTWTTRADMPVPKTVFSTSVVNGKIYAIGGSAGGFPWGPTLALATVEAYNPHPLIVDFNGDGIVDSADMCIMVDYWGIDEPLCDIGPMPWGDGIVDVQDLIVLAEHLFEDVSDPTLVAHWTLDETEGITAHDSVTGSDDIVMGDALWQPTGGMVDGALELDGLDDCIITTAGTNPADEPFSIFAWIKGGAPGQVIISQQIGADWLMADASEGKLMTELKGSAGLAGPLLSETVITDGQWHRIGMMWDGSHRTLCVDGVAVAEDMQPDLEGSQSGLYIGVGKNYAPGTFFSGLIDDVRIYNRAVSP